ncbi:MAG: helix-turn-helix domain-containing protein [Ruminococcus sp.]|nr:helix-turn-helix domain-containing protein [Ruminococcus sp.]
MKEFTSYTEWKKFFSRRISGLRASSGAGMSSRRLSQELNQCESYINKIETGRALPSMEMFFKICEYFCITPEEFFADDTEPHMKNELEQLFSSMSCSSRALLLALAKKLTEADAAGSKKNMYRR